MKRTLQTAFAMTSLALAMLTTSCGKAPQTKLQAEDSSQILGGTMVSTNDPISKTVVLIYDAAVGAICTGSILNNEFILTAAHCTESSPVDLRVVFGTDLQSPSVIVRAVLDYQESPFWAARQGAQKDHGDIAVLRFAGGLPSGYGPAQVLPDASSLVKGARITLAGYGTTRVAAEEKMLNLRKVDVSIADPLFAKTEVLLDQTSGRGACHGDSGGPAYLVASNGQTYLWGVTSRTANDPKDTCQAFSVYTNLLPYASWIKQTISTLMTTPSANTKKPHKEPTPRPSKAS